MADVRVCQLADGRELAWIELGAGGGTPVVAFHGSPGTCHGFGVVSEVAANNGVRLIATDRPGYGHSTFDPARTYESWARDVEQLADHLDLDRFAVVGHSSGGPNAAGCARSLDGRLDGCAILSGPAPPEAKIAKQAMIRSNRTAQKLAPLAPRLMGAAWQWGLRQAQRSPDNALAWMRRTLPPSDVAIIERPEVAGALRDEFARPLSATAGRAAVQDTQLERRPWGFDLGDIRMAVHVWHGRLDRNVVFASGQYQASVIPHTTLHEVPTGGHWLHYDHFGEILQSLTT